MKRSLGRADPEAARFKLAIVSLAIAIRVAAMLARGLAYNVPDSVYSPIGGEVGAVARSIATGDGFSSPILRAGETGPTAMVSPLYTYLLAGVFWVFGVYTFQSAQVILLFNCFVSALACLPIISVGQRLFGANGGLWAGLVWALLPYSVWHAAYAVQDASLAALLLATVIWAALRLEAEQRKWPWVAFGALLGVTTLVNAQAAGIVPFVLAWLAWHRRRGRSSWLLPSAVTAAVAAFVVLPWLVRNSLALGRPTFVRSNLGGELYLGFNPECEGPQTRRLWVDRNAEEMQHYRRLGEAAYFDEKAAAAVAFIRANPRRALTLVARRAALVVTGTPDVVAIFYLDGQYVLAKYVAYTLVMIIALLGIAALARHRRQEALLFGSVLFSYLLPEVIIYPTERHRHVVEPVLVLTGVYAVIAASRIRMTRPPVSASAESSAASAAE